MSRDLAPERLARVSDIARRAGALALLHYRRVEAERKADESFVTQADRAVERFIRDELEEAYPGETILGEEMGRRGMADAERVWLIDPIDGTTNFVHGLPIWCIAIGLLERGEAKLGVIYHPLLDELYAGEVELGAWRTTPQRAGEPMSVWPGRTPFSRTDPIAMSASLIRRDLKFPARIRSRCLGSAQWHFALVACGACRAGIWVGDFAWDVVAGIALVRAAGGEVVTCTGEQPDLAVLLDGRPQPWPLIACDAGSLDAMLEVAAPLRDSPSGGHA